MSKDEAEKWFKEVVPRLADLLLRLPELLEAHYQNAGAFHGMETGLRLLDSQQSGIVVLNQVTGCLCVCAGGWVWGRRNASSKRVGFTVQKMSTLL